MTSTTTPEFLQINGNRIHIADKHVDCETALVFIHGRCLSIKSWERQLNSELLAAFRLVAFDLPGHGLSSRSPNPMEDYSFQGSIRILTDVIDQLQLKKFFLVGNSLGGHIALEAMPTLAGCLGVFAMTMPITKPIPFDKVYLNGELLGKAYTENPASNDVSAYTQLLLQPNTTAFPEFLESDFYKTDPLVHQAIVQMVVAGAYEDETEIIRTSKLPVAIVVGAQEQIHNLSYLNDLILPVCQTSPLLVPDAGHLVQWENPDVVNQWLYSFVNEHIIRE